MSPKIVIATRLSLSFLWIFTGIISFSFAKDIGYQVLANAEITGLFADICIYAGSVLDIILGIWLLSGWRTSLCCIVQMVIIIIYTVLLSIIDPGYWLHPFGPLSKNIPILILVYILYESESEIKN